MLLVVHDAATQLARKLDNLAALDYPDFEVLIETLMGKKAEKRFDYIQANAKFVEDVDV